MIVMRRAVNYKMNIIYNSTLIPNVDIEYHGTRLGSITGTIVSNNPPRDGSGWRKIWRYLEVNDKQYPLEVHNSNGYVSIPPEETLELGSKVERVKKDIYIMVVFGDLLRKYHDRFKRNASMGLHEQLRHRADDIVEDLW